MSRLGRWYVYDKQVIIGLWVCECDNDIVEYVCVITCGINWIRFNQLDCVSSIKLLRYVYVVISL
jgi:hypothetical protein